MNRRFRNLLIPAAAFVLLLIILNGCSAAKKTGWELTQYPDRSGSQGMCYSLYDRESGDLILIDGGWVDNVQQVRDVIESHGGRVKAWFLTHYHADHAGAFTLLYEEYRDKIETVYLTPLDPDDFFEAAQSWDNTDTFEAFLRVTEGADNLTWLNRGAELDVGRFHVQNFNTYDDQVKVVGDIPNNCSLVFRVTADGVSMLFCGDVHNDALSHYLIEQYGDELKADVVQPGHHGNNSVSTDFYEFLEPKIMLFDAPEWLMTGENYHTKDLKNWCDEHGVAVYDYTTAPNVFVFSGGTFAAVADSVA